MGWKQSEVQGSLKDYVEKFFTPFSFNRARSGRTWTFYNLDLELVLKKIL